MAKLLQAGSTWNISIPAQLRPGQYILRSELAAIHNPQGSNPTSGPQMYITCVQLNVTGAGTQGLPMGTKAGALYDPKSAFAAYNVYVDKGRTFKVPGPSVWKPAAALEPPLPGNTSTTGSSTSSTRPGSSGTSSTMLSSFSTITATTAFSLTTPSVSTFTTPLLPSPSASTPASTAISADRILKHSSRCWRARSLGKAGVPPSS
jgi:cellulase